MRRDHINTAQMSEHVFRVRGHLHSRCHVPTLMNAEVLPMRPHLSDHEEEALISANRSRFDDTQFEEVRTPLRRPIPVGGGWVRKVWLVVRDTVLYVIGSRA